jgi:hypothetical protein
MIHTGKFADPSPSRARAAKILPPITIVLGSGYERFAEVEDNIHGPRITAEMRVQPDSMPIAVGKNIVDHYWRSPRRIDGP